MAKKGRTQDRHKSPRKVFHLSRELSDALEAYRRSLPHPVAESEVVRAFLKEGLAQRGFWKENGKK